MSLIGIFVYVFHEKLFPERPYAISMGKIDESATKKIQVDINATSDYIYSDLVDSTKYLALEENEHSRIMSVGDIVFHKDKIIVWDDRGQKIVGFDSNGNYLFNLYRKGNSKGEYRNLSEFTFDYNEELIVIKSWYKILWYDLNGQFIKSQELRYTKNIAVLEDSRLVSFSNYGFPLNTEPKANINILGENGKPTLGFSELASDVMTSNILNFSTHFSRYGNHLLLTNPYSQNVINVSDKEIFNRYNIDFGKNNIPKNYINVVLTNPNLDWGKIRRFERLNNWARLAGSAKENTHWLHFSVIIGEVSKQYFFNKHTEKFLYYEFVGFDEVGEVYPYILTVDGEWFVSLKTRQKIEKDFDDNGLKENEKDSSVNNDMNTNPVLQFTRLKELNQ